jgi:ubiquinone/menaquinone biosynthesis C-methylase UbiE
MLLSVSGANLKFFPSGSQLIMVDINNSLIDKLRKNLELFPELHLEKLLMTDAADMKDIPDNSVDAVISQYVLCSIKNVSGVLKEVKRVLVPVRKAIILISNIFI